MRGRDGAPWPPGASARSGAATSASGSAWCWISPPSGTRTGWSSLISDTMLSPGMSAAVTNDDLRPVEARVELEPEQAGMGVGRTDRRPVPGARGRRGRRRTSPSPVSLAGPSRRSGPRPRARPGTIVSAGTTSGAGAEGGTVDTRRAASLAREGTTRGWPRWPGVTRFAPFPSGLHRTPPRGAEGHRKGVPWPPETVPLGTSGPYSPAATIPGSAFILESFGPWINRPSRIC